MAVPLLERDAFLHTLDDLLGQVAEGSGRIALVSGEAGIGKTSLVEGFLQRRQAELRVLYGACEALFTPRALGPLYDIAYQTSGPILPLLDSTTNRAALFATVLADLTQASLPTVLVIEDLHWADEATLDLVKFLARRIHRTRALLIATYRDEELGRDHPLRLVLGDLPARAVTRLRVPPLSEAAVATLAQRADHPVHGLYLATGGNPFFLSEVLASDAPGVPSSVSDAVLAQVARRAPEAQRLLELVAVVPTKVERWVVEAVSAEYTCGLDECLTTGLLHREGNAIGYRHELARQAVESALSPTRRRTLHAQVLQALLGHSEEETSLARLVHHAAQAEDGALVLRFAPAAARQASAQGAHREAAAHFQTALRYADSLAAEQRAELLDELSQEYYLTGHMEDAIAPCEAALSIWRALNHHEQVGHDLRQLSRLSWFRGRLAEAEMHGMAAVELLETLPAGRELAMAYGNLSHLHMLQSNTSQAELWGGRAIDLAEQLHDTETLSYALNNVGSAQLDNGDDRGWAQLERSLQLALEHGYEEHVARAYANLASTMVTRRDYVQAEGYLQGGLAYCAERDLGSYGHCLRGHQARARLEQGDWAGADEDTTSILATPWANGANRIPALLILGRVRARRGDPGAEAVLDEVRELVVTTGVLERVLSVAEVRAEWRWLQGDRDQCVAEAEAGLQRALKQTHPWYVGELASWLWHAAGLRDVPAGTPFPFSVQMAGDWRAAAAAWEQVGCPYEQALALLDGDEAAQRQALDIFERLGARPAAEMVRRQLKVAGVHGLPRGPRPATRDNPQGLTTRQLEILGLLAEGLHNAEIAERLSMTPKTAAHHISDILAKLGARSRVDAVRVAIQLNILPQAMVPHP